MEITSQRRRVAILLTHHQKLPSVWSVGYAGTRGIFGGRAEFSEVPGTSIEVVPKVPRCRVLVLRSYRTYRSVGYRYRVRIEPYRGLRQGIETVPNHFDRVNTPGIPLPNCRVTVLRPYRTYQSVGYWWLGRTELAELSGTGIEFVLNLTGVFGRVLRPYRTLPKTLIEYVPSKYPRYTFVRTLPKTPLKFRPHVICSSPRAFTHSVRAFPAVAGCGSGRGCI